VEINILDLIQCVDIGIDSNTDVIRYLKPGSQVFRMDIIAARASATKYFQKIEKSHSRTAFIKNGLLTFLISAEEGAQYQLLEAILEYVIEEFNRIYGNMNFETMSGGVSTIFAGFESIIPGLFEKTQKERVKLLKANCRTCNCDFEVYVKKTLVEKGSNFPVSIVFLHKNHGMIIYIDANFKVRGAEITEITA
jgi:hypothetical protein